MTDDIKKLLHDYDTYKQLQAELQALETTLAKTKLRQMQTRRQLQALSDAMTFKDPLTWITYKYYAYLNEAQPIITMHDFRMHCSKPGYICTKRFMFLNEQLETHGLRRLDDRVVYPDAAELALVLSSHDMLSLSRDDSFLEVWRTYEFHRRDTAVAKWENYT